MQLSNTIKVEQKVAISPNLQQSLNILAMNNLDLITFINEECVDNPILETGENKNEKSEDEYLAEKLIYLENNKEKAYTKGMGEKDDYFEKADEEEVTLEKYLLSQIDRTRFKKIELSLLTILIKMIDDAGFLKESAEELSCLLNTDTEMINKLLTYIKQLNPIGVGCKDYRECLKLQLELCGRLGEELGLLVDEHLELLSKGNFAKVGRLMGIPSHKVKEYFIEIKRLNPIPGNGFGKREVVYIIPDVFVSFKGNQYTITLNDKYIPKVQISSYWHTMFQDIQKGQEDRDVLAYLNKKFEHASHIINALENRQQTLLKVCTAIVDKQYLFFKTGKKSDLVPLRLKDIAHEIGVHESTVSRALQNKYLSCQWEVLSLKSFFTGAVSKLQEDICYDDGMSKEAIKEHIKTLIQEEDKTNPISDAKIENILRSRGVHVSRRTVVKYREELNIGNSFQRRV
ncbi:MAG: hypothetical protein K0S71_1973 [Clostridia bacterium]|jgi:RNA polymerase sigma-54 factor|nr:hypothetical protein [Clostridia bacterium]